MNRTNGTGHLISVNYIFRPCHDRGFYFALGINVKFYKIICIKSFLSSLSILIKIIN